MSNQTQPKTIADLDALQKSLNPARAASYAIARLPRRLRQVRPRHSRRQPRPRHKRQARHPLRHDGVARASVEQLTIHKLAAYAKRRAFTNKDKT